MRLFESGSMKPKWAFGSSLAILAVGGFVSYKWTDGKLDFLYIGAALGIVLFSLKGVRDALENLVGRISNVKVGKVEVVLGQIADAVSSMSLIPDIENNSPTDESKQNQFIEENWTNDPTGAIETLCRTAKSHQAWVDKELGEDSPGPGLKPADWFAEAMRRRLISDQERRILSGLFTIDLAAIKKVMEGSDREHRDQVIVFVETAERILGRFRTRCLDQWVKTNLLPKLGYGIMEISGQHRSRWPDFYIFKEADPRENPMRMTVRATWKKNSPILNRATERFQKLGEEPETPLDPITSERIVVVPSDAPFGDSLNGARVIKRSMLEEDLPA